MSRLTAMGEMASALAHELNQPLSAIANYMNGSRRLLEDSTDPNAPACCARPWTRPPSRRCAPARSSAGCAISWRAARASGASKTSGSWSRRRARWRWSAPGTRACGCGSNFRRAADFVLADKVQIQQVLLNLMRNAIEAMEDSETRDLVVVNGAGGGQHDRDQRCRHRRRHRAGDQAASCSSRSSPPRRQGMGVGLSISRTIIEAHGGAIAPRANPGGGTVFVVHSARGHQGGGRRCRLKRESCTSSTTTSACANRSHSCCARRKIRGPRLRLRDGIPRDASRITAGAASSPTCACRA